MDHQQLDNLANHDIVIFGYSSTGDLPTESGMKYAPDY